jgi:hypothetical protein
MVHRHRPPREPMDRVELPVGRHRDLRCVRPVRREPALRSYQLSFITYTQHG